LIFVSFGKSSVLTRKSYPRVLLSVAAFRKSGRNTVLSVSDINELAATTLVAANIKKMHTSKLVLVERGLRESCKKFPIFTCNLQSLNTLSTSLEHNRRKNKKIKCMVRTPLFSPIYFVFVNFLFYIIAI